MQATLVHNDSGRRARRGIRTGKAYSTVLDPGSVRNQGMVTPHYPTVRLGFGDGGELRDLLKKIL